MIRRFEDILAQVEEYNSGADVELLKKAYVFSAREHRDQKRHSGEPYLIHPLEVAYLLAELRLDTASIVAGLLHDVVEDTLTTVEKVKENFGADVAELVEGVTKISKLRFASPEEAQAENIRKMILAMVGDIRVILVKLADRLHNMRTLEALSPEKQQRIALETKEIYAPLANRLGIGRFKHELEDLSFRYLDPEGFGQLSRALQSRRKVSDRFIDDIRIRLEGAMKDAGIVAEIKGRIKSIYSIHQKMRAQRISVDEVYDYTAFRILTEDVRDCYGAMGIVHSIWRPVPGRIKDYIAMPKPNLYRSLHTSVMSEKGHPFEVQIRTHEMHRVAEEGIAAHWQYKEHDGGIRPQDAEDMSWVRQIMELQKDLTDPSDFVNLMKVDLFADEVYTFTPKGNVLSLAAGATPIDFAYMIHTEIGHTTVGAKVNGRIVPLKYELQNGDIVEILTQPSKHPNRDWLTIARTSRARSKIRAWINASERAESIELGRELAEKEMRRFKLSPRRYFQGDAFQEALQKLGCTDMDDYHAAVGYGRLTAHSLIQQLVPDEALKEKPQGVVRRVVERALGTGGRGVQVRGLDDMMINLANCCNPVRGEQIVGYITRGKGVSVHSVVCPNVKNLLYDAERRIAVEWKSGGHNTLFDIELKLDVEDRQGLLAKIVAVVSDMKTNIKNVDADTFETSDAEITMVVAVTDRKHMERVMKGIRKIKGVRDVGRVISRPTTEENS